MRAQEFIKEEITATDLGEIERFADSMWHKLGIDVAFTRHFLDRVNDERNGKPITTAELVRLLKKEYEQNQKGISTMREPEAVMKDLSTQINVPFALNPRPRGRQLVAKTVMRKANFHSPDREFPVK